jgi:hypothetical protein
VILGLIANTSSAKLDIFFPFFLLCLYYSSLGIIGQSI